MSKIIDVDFGFASFKDGMFELIVRDRQTWKEVTLRGSMKEQTYTLEQIDQVLPTCVFVRGVADAQKL